MTGHSHVDVDRLTFGCPGCVERAEQARIDNAPLRRVTWRCTYLDPAGGVRDVSFTREVKVPDGWTPAQVDELHAGLTGEAFVMALPDDIPMEDTVRALESMEVERVSIGDLVPQERDPGHVQEQLL